jgi:hypothetical protein
MSATDLVTFAAVPWFSLRRRACLLPAGAARDIVDPVIALREE